MPQLDLATYFSQTLFVLIAFWTLVYAMIFYFLKHGVVYRKLRVKIQNLRAQSAYTGQHLWTLGAQRRLQVPASAVSATLTAGAALTVTLDTAWPAIVLASRSFDEEEARITQCLTSPLFTAAARFKLTDAYERMPRPKKSDGINPVN